MIIICNLKMPLILFKIVQKNGQGVNKIKKPRKIKNN